MRKLLSLIVGLVVAAGASFAQTTVNNFPALETNNTFSGNNMFPQINGAYVVGISPSVLTVQQAVTKACLSSTVSIVDMPPFVSPSQSVGAVTGGCSNVSVLDRRSVPNNCYTWNGTFYSQTGCFSTATIPGTVNQVPVASGANGAVASPVTIDSVTGFTTTPCVNPIVVGVAKARCREDNLIITHGMTNAVQFPDYGLHLSNNFFLHGGSNYFNQQLQQPQWKSNYLIRLDTSWFNTLGQHIAASRQINCMAHGDCLLGSTDFGTVAGGFGDQADEGPHLSGPLLQEEGTVLSTTCTSGCSTGSTTLTIAAGNQANRLGDDRWIEDWNPAHTLSPSCVITSGASQGSPLAYVNLSSTCTPNSTVVLSTTSFPSTATQIAAGLQTVAIVASGQPTGFANSTSGFAASGVAYVADYDGGVDADYYEQTTYTVVDPTHLQVNFLRPHPTQVVIATGGWSGYDLIPTANVNGTVSQIVSNGAVAQSSHVVFSLNNRAYLGYYSATVDVADGAGINTPTESKVANWSNNITTISRASNVVTVTTAVGSLPLDGLSVVVAGVTDASFNGTFPFTQTGPGTYTYNQTAANASSSGGTITYSNGSFVLVPSAQILSVMNTATNAIDGTMALYPNNVSWATSQPVVFPHDVHMRIMGTSGWGGLKSIQPAPNFFAAFAHGGNGVWLQGEPGASKTGYTVKFTMDHPERYIGHGGGCSTGLCGTKDIPGAAYAIDVSSSGTGFYKYAAYFPLGDFGGTYYAMNYFGRTKGACDWRAVSPVLRFEFASSQTDDFTYNPCLRQLTWGARLNIGDVLFAQHTVRSGGGYWFTDATGNTAQVQVTTQDGSGIWFQHPDNSFAPIRTNSHFIYNNGSVRWNNGTTDDAGLSRNLAGTVCVDNVAGDCTGTIKAANGALTSITAASTTSTNITSTTTNNVVEAAAYAGADCGTKIQNATNANVGNPVQINVSQACGMTIISQVFVNQGHHIKFTQGGTWTVGGNGTGFSGSSAFYLSDNSSIEGIGPQVTLQTIPGTNASGRAIIIAPGFWNSNSVKHVRVGNFSMDGNADAWNVGGGTGFADYPLEIHGANDGVTAGPSDIRLDHLWFKNTNGKGIGIGAEVNNGFGPHDIDADHLYFDQGYLFDIQLGMGLSNVKFSHVYVRHFMKPISVPVASATSANGTNIVITTTTPVPNVFTTSNGGFIFVSGCSDPKYNVAAVNLAPTQLDNNPAGTTNVQYHNLTGGAAASATGCQLTFQNAQAPIRGDFAAANPSGSLTFDNFYGVNDYKSQEFFFELFNDTTHDSHIRDSILDANGSSGGTGISMNFTHGSIENVKLLNGAGGQLGNGCECSGSDNKYIGNQFNSGALMAGVGNNVVVANNVFTGCQVNGHILVNGLTNSSITGNTIDSSCANNGVGISLGWEGQNDPVNNMVVAGNTITMAGALNTGIVLGGNSASQGLDISHNIIRNAGVGIGTFNNVDGSYPPLAGITISKNDFSGVLTQSLSLGGTSNVIVEDNIFPPMIAPGTVTPTGSTTGGTLAAATYFYKVTAVNAQGQTAGSPEASVTTTGTTSSVGLAWAAVTGAASYKVYRGTATGTENVFYTTATNSFTDTGAANTAGTVPTINTASTKADTEAQTGLTAYDHITLLPMTTVGTGSVLLLGGGGASTWNYTCVGYDVAGNNTAPVTLTVGNTATLSTAHDHIINCPYFKGATRTKIWRIAPSGTAGKVVDVLNPSGVYLDQTGTATLDSSTPPAAAVGSFTGANITATVQGNATLVAGTVTVSSTAALAATSGGHYALTNCGTGGTVGVLSVGTVVAGTSFVINSSSATDTSNVCWQIH